MTEEATRRRQGTAYGFLAYLIWGVFPFYFATLRPAGPWEILSHRIIWTLVICGVLLLLARDLRWLVQLARTPKRLAGLVLAGMLIAVNWGVYTYAVLSGHITEAALGYFMNPLFTVGLGVVILRERLRGMQWAAVVVGALAAVYLTIDYGHPPWVSLTLATSFALYSLLKNRLGVSLSPVRTLFGESLAILPLAIGILIWLDLTGATTWGGHGPLHTGLLMSTGVATAVPLLLFAAAAARVPLSTIGLLQFVAPVLQLTSGLILGETMALSRWVGFGLVWVALVLLSVDMVGQVRRSRRSRTRHRVEGDAAPAPGTTPPHP